MQPKLTISDLLKKHFGTEKPYGSIQTNAAKLGIKPKQFGVWYSGVATPNSDTTILLLRRMGELANYKPEE